MSEQTTLSSQYKENRRAGGGYVQEGLAEVCRETAGQGIVMLRNDGILPLEGKKVAVFGRVQYDYMFVGYGSGGNVLAPYRRNLMDGLADDGIEFDSVLSSIYRKWCDAHRLGPAIWGHWPYHYEEMPMTPSLAVDAAKRADVAVVVIGRAAGEEREGLLEKGSYYLTDDERGLLGMVTSAFKKTVVVIDTGNNMDFSWIDEFGISAVLLAWQGGMEAGRAVADLLCGKATPSGKLTDTIACRFEDYPSSSNFGNKEFNNYVEDIYVGYRYFESFAKDKVQFPFGFGLSYTTFDISATGFSYDGKSVAVKVSVTNTGSRYSGAEVVQLYVQAPQCRMGKSARSLCAFAKTRVLKPGETQKLVLSLDVQSIASYDDSGITGNRSCFVLEAGEYRFHVGSSVRDTVECGVFSLDGLVVTERLSEVMAPEKGCGFKRMKAREIDGKLAIDYETIPEKTVDRKAVIQANLPAESVAELEGPVTFEDVKSGRITLDEFIAHLSDEEISDLCIGQGSMNSRYGIRGNTGTFGGYRQSMQEKGVVPIVTADGPAGIRAKSKASLLPCGTAIASTWNTDLINELGILVGKEIAGNSVDVLLAPGMNIHRSPLCGRNFEYYSEDPLISGKIAAAFVRGVQIDGLSACPKHFACNNQETNRFANDSRVSERALREIYLKGFEICVKEAKPNNIMTSYNKINGTFSYYNYDLATRVLRGEWGYEGNIVTDWWTTPQTDPDFGDSNDAYRVRAQVDVLMPGGWRRFVTWHDRSLMRALNKGTISRGEIQRSAKNVLRFVLKKKY